MREIEYLKIIIKKADNAKLTPFMIERLEQVLARLQELEALQQTKTCETATCQQQKLGA